jgi:hypothetical protein
MIVETVFLSLLFSWLGSLRADESRAVLIR